MYLFECNINTKDISKEVLVVFSGQLEGNELDYSYEIETKFRGFSNSPEEVFFVFPCYIANIVVSKFAKGSKCYNNITRFGSHTPVTLLGFDRDGALHATAINGESSLCSDLKYLEDEIVRKGIFNLAETHREQVILKAPSGTVFIKPSNREYDEFIKASDLVVGYSENQFVAFCLLSRSPKSKKIKKIFIDTNSISPFIEALLFYWTNFSNSVCRTAVYHSFGSYEGRSAAKPDIVSDVWLIISASRSNSMGICMAKEWKLENDQVITLLSYTDSENSKTGDEILANISTLTRSTLGYGENSSLLKVKLIGENFTAEIEKPNPVFIKAVHKTTAIDAWIIPNIGTGLFKCNRRLAASLPLSPVFINCSCYFSTSLEYRDWLTRIIGWYVPMKTKWLVYQKADDASKKLIQDIESRLLENGITEYKKIDINDADTSISGDDSVIVAAPVTETGQSLLKLNRNLRISGHNGNRIFISPFVVAGSQAQFEQCLKSLTYGPKDMKYQFFSLNKVFIGHLEKQSSWELELDVVEHLSGDFWARRTEILRSRHNGLCGYIGTPSLEIDEKLGFTGDFVFFAQKYKLEDVDPESVYLTISSVLQNLREKPYSKSQDDSLYSHVYQHSVISPENFERFNDGLLQSCLWRAANTAELDYRNSQELSAGFCEILSRLIEENSSGVKNAAVDLLMGLAVRKIRISTTSMTQLLDCAGKSYQNNSAHAQQLIDFIRKRYFPGPYHEQGNTVV